MAWSGDTLFACEACEAPLLAITAAKGVWRMRGRCSCGWEAELDLTGVRE